MVHYVLILAAGAGIRLKNAKIPKQFLELDNRPLVMHSAIAFKQADPNAELYIALPKGYALKWEKLCQKYNFYIPHTIYVGGESRRDTVLIGLKKIYDTINSTSLGKELSAKKPLVSIHDAARPFISPEFILELITSAKQHGSAVPVLNLKNSLRKFNREQEFTSFYRNRDHYVITQTPQVFIFNDIYNAYLKVTKFESSNLDKQFFDDSAFFDYLNNMKFAHTIKGREYNIKITSDLDYFLAPRIYKFFKGLR